MRFRPAHLLAALLAVCPAQAAEEKKVLAVLSSAAGAYLDAFSAFQAEYGARVDYIDESKSGRAGIPAGTDIVVAFGARAAGRKYPTDVHLVYCLTPGLVLEPQKRQGRTIKISMLVHPDLLLARLKLLQPTLKRLAYFWTAPGYSGGFEEETRKAGKAAGVEILPFRVSDPAGLPGALRAALNRMDAFWLPPDPLLFSPENLMIFKRFSLDNGIPMYAGTKALAHEGAVATLGVSFDESGRLAAGAVKALQRGENPPEQVYSSRVELTLNASSAKRCGIELKPEVLEMSGHVYP